MLDSILNSVKDQIGGEVLGKTGISESQFDDIIKLAGESSEEVISGKLTPDNLEGIINLFSSTGNAAPAENIQNDLISNYMGKLISKTGLSESMAKTIAALVIPKIIEMITGENEKTPPSDISPLINLFAGKSSGSIGDSLGNALGGLFK